jgi:hypothetical protein
LLGAAAAGAGDARYGNGEIRVGTQERAASHFAHRGLADGALFLQSASCTPRTLALSALE